MNADQVTAELTGVFREVFDDPAMTLQRDLTADEVEGWDSARMVEIIIATEAKFGISLTTRETDSLKCVGDLIDVVARKAGGAA